MNKLVVAIFPDEAKAYETACALEEVRDPADATVRGLAVIVKHADGTLSEKKWNSRVPFRALIGAVVGALIGLAAGPVGSAIGFAGGGIIGFTRDLANYGIEESFVHETAAQLTPGKSALIIEVSEDASTQLEARLRRLGATVSSTTTVSD